MKTLSTLVLVALGIFAASAVARVDEATHDRDLYVRYCGACHGAGGKGDGPVAGVMYPTPADLTRLAERNHDKFPTQWVMRVVEGQAQIPAHGEPGMPVWGEDFRREPFGTRAKIREKVMRITAHLRAIQER